MLDTAVFNQNFPALFRHVLGFGRTTILFARFQCILAASSTILLALEPRHARNFLEFTPPPLSRVKLFMNESLVGTEIMLRAH